MTPQYSDIISKNPDEILAFTHETFGNLSTDSAHRLEFMCLTSGGWVHGRYLGLNFRGSQRTLVLEVGREADRNILFLDVAHIQGLQIQGLKSFLQAVETQTKNFSPEPISKLAAERLLLELSGYLKNDKQTPDFSMNYDWTKLEYTESFSKRVKGLFETTYEVLNLIPSANFQKLFAQKPFKLKNEIGSSLRLEVGSGDVVISGDFTNIDLNSYKDQLNKILKDV